MNEQQMRQKILTMEAQLEANRSERVAGEIKDAVAQQAPNAPKALTSLAKATLAGEKGDISNAVRGFLKSDDAKPFLALPKPVEEPTPEPAPGSYIDGGFVMREPKPSGQKAAEQSEPKVSELEKALSEIASGKAKIQMSR